MKQSAIAKVAGVSRAAVNHWMHGRALPSFLPLYRYLKTLETAEERWDVMERIYHAWEMGTARTKASPASEESRSETGK